jgi:acyl-CoA synthetase (AMP-forming)/AMP-acid ligase II
MEIRSARKCSRENLKQGPEERRLGIILEETPSDLVALLRQRATHKPKACAYVFLADGESEEQRLSYGQLDDRARVIAAHLQGTGMAGERALLLYPPGLDYIVAFFACLYAGVVAVPAYPPSRHHLHRLKAIVHDAAPALVLTQAEWRDKLIDRYEESWGRDGLKWLATDTLDGTEVAPWTPPVMRPESLAFLQYTSGSTGNPKGVMVSHRNLMANQWVIKESFQHTEHTIVVGWLPLYHDMGLIGNLLQSLYLGSTAILMSPLAFLEQPVRWLRAISKYRAATSGGPNFAYELCVRKVTPEQKRDLDLSSWTLAFNGSEPVRATTVERFTEVFAECGFRRESFFPCYGLAEATLFVTGPTRGEPLVVRHLNTELTQPF